MRVEIRGVGFSYPESEGGVNRVLDRLDLDVASGSVHAIVGGNGCGKTTLLRIVAGLEAPAEGAVRFVGRRRRDNLTAMVFQEPRLIPWWDVERNVGTSVEFKAGMSERLYRRITDFRLRQVGLHDLRHRTPATLSRGQQTRAGVGRAFTHDAEVVLLDEPFVHIDALARRRLQEELETHWQLDPRTTMLVTHDIEEAVLMSDRVSVMRGAPGRVTETVEVDAPRPRFGLTAHPGIRSAFANVWSALERASSRSP